MAKTAQPCLTQSINLCYGLEMCTTTPHHCAAENVLFAVSQPFQAKWEKKKYLSRVIFVPLSDNSLQLKPSFTALVKQAAIREKLNHWNNSSDLHSYRITRKDSSDHDSFIHSVFSEPADATACLDPFRTAHSKHVC